MKEFEMENIDLVLNAVKQIAEQDKYHTADLTDVLRFLGRRGLPEVETIRLLARLKSQHKIGGEVIGRSYILILNP